MKKSVIILSIETSCDETSIALLRCNGTLKAPKFKILKNIISSQIKIHRPFGGVVPNLAKREHIKNLPKALRLLRISGVKLKRMVSLIAVTVGPGLEPALWTGINFAEALSQKLNKPLVGVSHMEGHLYSCFLPKTTVISKSQFLISKKSSKSKLPITNYQLPKIEFPAIALIVSGGHTILLHMTAISKWTKLGETLDDAAGEAFDKVARMLELPYPGGPEIQKLSAKGNPNAIKFPHPLLNPKSAKDKYNFSFSGLKTSALYYLRDLNPKPLTLNAKADVAASFQQAVIDVLVKKTIRAAEEFKVKTVLLCGGVSANKPLQETLRTTAYDLRTNFIVPDFQYNTDNAAMIGAAAYINILQKNKKRLKIEAQGNLNI
ncbi:MAG: tRNA (adenosine(37)-N6)-threonylcarbamoyltransferase complex transferase subunit TsaD [Candidatus Harrisonbacteria bacterium]|nr:tRNA (adenosine(37)-N6)-threonylcarbamoyltransferase complex transferase subunit TsaD [Candidatus Harrisonbacteria bacterium]